MHTLADLQREFQRNVRHGDPDMEALIVGTPEVPAATRLAIYSEAYRLRLIDALASNVPRLQQLLGDDAFAQLAQRYIDERPSAYRSIRWFGDRLAHELAQSHAAQPWLAELARWEWAIAAAFDAGDAATVGEEALAAVPAEAWPALRLGFHPSVQRLQMRTNAPALFKALSEDLPAPDPVVLEREQPWLIWRQALKTQYRSLDAAGAAALDAMRSDATFADMCALLCEWHEPEQVPLLAAGLLKQWLADDLLTGVVISP
jgi:hypothetical protein